MFEQRSVVVGLDGSPGGLAVAEFAAVEAMRRDATLVIAHVWPSRYAGPYRNLGPLPTREDGRRLLDVAASLAGTAAPNLRIRTEFLEGSAGQALLRETATASLIVVAHRTVPGGRSNSGSTSAYLAHHSACPVLVFRGSAPNRGPVVAAVAARPGMTATIASAFAEAALYGNRLVAVHMWSPTDPQPELPRTPTAEYLAEHREVERVLAESLAGWSGRYPDVQVERLLIQETDLAYTLARASRRGCRLVAGTGQTGQFTDLLFGSHTPAASRQALCPLLLVPSEAAKSCPKPKPKPAPEEIAVGVTSPGRRS